MNKAEKTEFLRLRNDVLALLDEYKGEEIVKDEHPLHLAVQRLEAACNPRKDKLGASQNKLFPGANVWWFSLLDASRGQTEPRRGPRFEDLKSMEYPYLVKGLKRVLKSWKGKTLDELKASMNRNIESALVNRAAK